MSNSNAHIPLVELRKLYDGTGTINDASEVFRLKFRLELAILEKRSPVPITDKTLNNILTNRITRGLTDFEVEMPRSEDELVRTTAKIITTYPWLGNLAQRGSGELNPDRFEQQVGNHTFDAAPLPYGLSQQESYKMRAFLENDTAEFRRLARLALIF